MKITIVENHSILDIPPTITLTRVLLSQGHDIKLVANNVDSLDESIKKQTNLELINIQHGYQESTSKLEKLCSRIIQQKNLKHVVNDLMKESDILWTTSDIIVRDLGKTVLNYKHVMHLMELMQQGYLYHKHFPYPIETYAQRAWKNVVAEENRAYIQKAWWNLNKLPFVFPNKPYTLEHGEIPDAQIEKINKIKEEKKKIILYLGGIWEDRNIDVFSNAIKRTSNYRLCIIGKAYSSKSQYLLNKMIEQDDVLYLGWYPTPKHLAFLPHVHIGLLPYIPSTDGNQSELNALYCAPNKIFEYAGFGVPMIGTDVMGLKYPFERYNIGEVCKTLTPEGIIEAIEKVEENYDEMKKNCYQYYDLYDLDEIVRNILSDQ